MKKITLTLAAGLLLFASCKKDWTCSCTANGVGYTAATYTDTKKADAKASCDAVQNLAIIFEPSTSCTID